MKTAQVVIILILAFIVSPKVSAQNTSPDSSVTVTKIPAVSVELTKEELSSTTTQEWWQHLLVTVISTIGTVAVPVLSTLLVVLLRRWNIRVEYEKAEWFAKQGKNYAEQMARNALKDGKRVDINKTSQLALEYSRDLARGKLAPWAAKELSGLIEAQLGQDNHAKPKPGEAVSTPQPQEAT